VRPHLLGLATIPLYYEAGTNLVHPGDPSICEEELSLKRFIDTNDTAVPALSLEQIAQAAEARTKAQVNNAAGNTKSDATASTALIWC
jgi:hypothetical protein